MNVYLLQLKDINMHYNYHKFNENHVLKNVNLTINKGEFIVIMGQSGSGKSTLLNIITSNLIPTSGTIIIEGDTIIEFCGEKTDWRLKGISYILQEFNLLDSLTNRENIMLANIEDSVNVKSLDRMIDELSKMLSVDAVIEKYPYECSGGEQQRVAIVKALVNNPNIIVADEPTGNLDSANTKDVMCILKKMNSMGYTIILVTHNIDVAAYGSRVIYLKDGIISKELINKGKSIYDFKNDIIKANDYLFFEENNG